MGIQIGNMAQFSNDAAGARSAYVVASSAVSCYRSAKAGGDTSHLVKDASAGVDNVVIDSSLTNDPDAN